MKILMVDPSLKSFGGHFFNLDRLICGELAKRGLVGVVCCHREVDPAVRSALGAASAPMFVSGLFDATTWGQPPSVLAAQVESLLLVNDLTYRSLALLTPLVTRDDLVLFPSMNQRGMVAVGKWVGDLPDGKTPRLVVGMAGPMTDRPDNPDGDLGLAMYATGFNALRHAVARPEKAGRTRVYQYIRDTGYARVWGAPVPVMPFSQISRDLVAGYLAVAEAPRPPTFFAPSAVSRVKGAHLLPGAVRRLLDHAPEARVVVGADPARCDDIDDALAAFRVLAERQPGFRLISESQTDDAFFRTLAGSDVIVLPHLPWNTHASGLANEAVAFGKTIVALRGGVPNQVIADYDASHVLAEATEDSLGAALCRALPLIERDAAHRRAVAERFLRRNGVEPLVDYLLEP